MEEIKDVSIIQDEDVLRRMWQATEDFSRKKEIRSHMYKLREARLKEFYTTGEVLKDVQRSNSSPGLRDQHPCAKVEGPTHADSLADHSFLSLKTKEIRDSESPTREVQYRNSKNRDTDGQWTITSNTTKSDDGKRITSSQLATTQGVRAIDGGQLAYAAANEHQASVYADGDDKNYTRSKGESSKTFAQQNVVAGDENNFRSSKTTSSSSSSKVVMEHSSTTGDVGDFQRLAITGSDEIDDGPRTIYIERPEEHFTVNTSENVRKIQDVKSSKVVYQPEEVKSTRTVSKTTYSSGEIPDDLKKSIADGNTKVFTETKTLPDGSTITTTRYETKGSKKFGSTQVTSNRQTVEQKSSTTDNRINKQIEYITGNDDDNTSRTITTKTIREIYDDDAAPRRPTNRNDVNKTESVRIIQSEKQLYDDDIKTSKIINVQNECNVTRNTENIRQDRKVIRDQDTRDVIVKVTRTMEDQLPREPVPETKEIHTTVTTTKTVNVTDEPIRSPTKIKPDEVRPQPEVASPTRSRPQDKQQPQEKQHPQELVKSCKPEEKYNPTSPTDGQYSTTYRSEFTNKRVSVDISPTHDAFARSLRSISPDRIGDRPKSRGSVKNSTSSLRSSISPEKQPQPTRMSPERKPGYDRRSPDKFTDQKRHTTSPSRPNDERKSPERKYPRPDSITVTKTTEIRRKPSSKSPERYVQSFSPARTPTSPTKTDVTITRTTKVTRNPSPTKPTERTSPLRSPTKETAPVNSDTITRKKKIPVDDERKSPVRSPTKTTTTEITVNTDTITRKKKVPEDDICSPKKSTTIETETTNVNSDTITRKKKHHSSDEPENGKPSERRPSSPKKPKGKITTDIDETEIITEKIRKPSSRDVSPTSLASDIEFINHNRHIVTDLDEPGEAPEKRPTTLEITETTVTTKKIKPVSNSPKHPSSPVKESPRQKSPSKSSPTKDSPTKSSPVKEVPKKFKPSAPELDSPSERPPTNFTIPDDDFEQVCEVTPKEKPPLKRTETYEERCREMLGLSEPEDKIPKKEYIDMYAGMEPVEEPMMTKKHVTPLGPIGPEDELMYETIKKIHERRPEYPDGEIEPVIEDFIVTEKKDVVEAEKKRKPTKVTSIPDRKSPGKQKPQIPKDDGEYNTEYTDEFCDKPITEKPSNKKPTTDSKDKKTTPKSSSPQRKSPEKKLPKDKEPTDDEYNTEYTDEYGERPDKPKGEKITTRVTTTVNKNSITDKKSPERKPQQSKLPQKKRQEDTEFTTEYTDEYCEVTDKVTTTKKPAGKKTEHTPKTNDIAPVRGIPSSTKRTPDKKSATKKPDESSDEEEDIDKKIHRKSPSPVRRIPVLDRRSPSRDHESPSRGLPQNITVTEYINEYKEDDDFINQEKYDTDITLERKSPTKLIDIEFDLDQNTQDVHIRTHRIDTTITDQDSSKPREISPRRQPQRAVPSDTMECTFKITTTEDEQVTSLKKKQQPEEPKKKPQPKPEDRKSPVKQINKKDSVPKITSTKLVTKKMSSTDIDTKRREEIPKKKSPKEKSPERYDRSKARSPSPSSRTVIKNERNITQVTRKTSSKDIPTKKVPGKPLSPVRKPTSPERKPSKPISKTSPIQPSSKHVVTKTISLKPQPSSPVKPAPKTVTTVKTTKITQPSTVTVTTVKTTKTTKKTIKPQKVNNDSSDSELEPEVVDKKKVVTTANIKISNGVVKQPSPSRIPKEPNVTMPYIKRSTSSREPSPDKICPIPVSSEDEGGYPRYPDQVSEPDDLPSRRKPVKIADIPLTEEEDVKNFSRITDVTETTRKPSPRITDIDKVTETDESLLSVTEKVSRFITTAEKLTEDEPKNKTPAPRVPRPELVVDETLEDDECLLSVSDKVTKFITTTDHVDRPKSPRPRERTPVDVKVNEDDECLLSVNQKVSHFIQAAETVKHKPSTKEGPAPKVNRPNFTVDETLKTDECLLSVSDKVSKFLTTAEKLTTTKTETTIKREPSPAPRREYSPEKTTPKREYSPEKITPKREYSPEKITPKREYSPEKIIPRRESPEKINRTEITVKREFSPEKSRQSPIRKTPETCSQPSRPKSEPSKPAEIKQTNLKSSEAVRKAKAMFENISKTQEVPKQRDILSRPSIWEGRKKPEVKPEDDDVKLTDIGVYKKKEPEIKKQLIYTSEDEESCKRISTDLKNVTLKSTKLILNENRDKSRYLSPEKDIPGYMKPIQKPSTTTELTVERKIQRSRSPNPNGERPGYMQPLSKHQYEDTDKPIQRSRSPYPTGEVPGYMQPLSKHQHEDVDKPIQRSRSPYLTGEVPGYMQPLSKHQHEDVEKPIQRSRSPNPTGEVPGYMRPIHKVNSEERSKYIIETRTRETYSPEREEIDTHRTRHYENGDIPHYMLPLQRNITPDRERKPKDEEIEIVETIIERHRTPEREIPGYMKPLQRHVHSPDREERRPSEDATDDGPKAGKKFGVTLRRTDSGRMVQTTVNTTVTERRRSTTPGQQVVEDIQDLEVLERMMDKVVGYEQRRRIRAQIRVVKKLISENKIQKRTKLAPSPIRDPTVSKSSPSSCTTTASDRRSPMRDPKRSSVSPSKKTPEIRQKSPEPKHKSTTIDSKTSISSVTTTNQKVVIQSSKERSCSPEPKKRVHPPAPMYKPDLKPVQPSSKILQEDKPSWVMNRNLKKTTNETVVDKRVVSPKKIETILRRSPSPQKDSKPLDCITSSYGIGPTDENGQPLFGIKALRKAANDSKVQVRGTVVTSQFYSENGQEPVGEVTVTKYTNDPRELNVDDEEIKKSKGLASVTTTQKFGSRGTPTLTALVDKKKAITDKHSEEDEIFKTTSTKVTRRGSVKALSQKFIENAVEISRNERQNYPKAGLILRTSSFKDTTQTSNDRNSSRESSPGVQNRSGKISLESMSSDSQQESHSVQDTSSTTTKTFLNSHTRVANAQEVISRMKNAEKEHHERDSAEDREARMLLNKFLGAQVLMSGMEPLLTKSATVTTSTSSSASAQLVRKVQKTKTTTSTTTKEASKPLSLTKRFQTPITTEVLQDIWDEQTLRALLEQCTDYEERRAIRARLRQVMAEQEAVANVVASAVSESGDRSMQERIERSKKSYSDGPVTTTHVSTTRVIQARQQVIKPISPFAKFRQLDKQNSLNTPPSSPRTPTGTGAPLFKFTDPALSQSASTVKDRLLHWCQIKTKEYQNIKLENFSTCWADGMAFCALIHHFLPDAFDYHALNPKQRRHNFTLAFKVADEQADIAPLLDVDDMVAMRRPDWKCVFTYVQSIYRRFKDED